MKVVCAAKNCKYSLETENTSHVIFINFPNDDTSKIWAQHCDRPDLLMKSNRELHVDYYVCSHHVVDQCYINKTYPIAEGVVPTLLGIDQCTENSLTDMFDSNEQVEATNNVELTYCDVNVEISHYQGIEFSSLCRICGESSADGIEIFAPKGIELKLKEKIALHMPISVDVDDVISQKICINCYDKLEMTHSFVITCLRTDMRLKRSLNINAEPEYDNRYNSLIEECCLEVSKDICMYEKTKNESIQLSSDNVENLVNAHNLDMGLKNLKNVDINKNGFGDITKSDISQIATLMESYEQPDNEIVENIGESRRNFQEKASDNELLCRKEEIIDLQRQKGINCDTNKSFPKRAEVMYHELIPSIQQIIPNKQLFEEDNIDTSKRVSDKYNHTNHLSSEDVTRLDIVKNNADEQSFIEVNKKCGHCDTAYSTKKELLNHIALCHDGKLLFKCFICSKIYEKWSSLDVHEATHRIDKPYLCDLCGKSFKHSNNLRGHKRTHLDESQRKKHICMICSSAFRSRFHLREHMNQHDGKKPYSCDQCDKAFYKRIQLRQHTLSHGSSRHVCPICGVTFNRKGNMTTHFKRHSNEVGTYTCSVCKHRCKSMSELKMHRKKHTQEDIVQSIKKKLRKKKIGFNYKYHPLSIKLVKISRQQQWIIFTRDYKTIPKSTAILMTMVEAIYGIFMPEKLCF
ncbi:hypothetical protein KM043_010382 [Ampulex compressa]|nr:hypothetical protein KM043_010382 [Ampulex compressa]